MTRAHAGATRGLLLRSGEGLREGARGRSEDEDWFDDDADMSDDDDMLVDPADEFTPLSLE